MYGDARYDLARVVSDVQAAMGWTNHLDMNLREVEQVIRKVPSAAGGLTVDSLYWSADGVADPDATAREAVESVAALRREVTEIDTALVQIRGLVRSLDVDDGLARS
ncbi:hypothetical protein [Nocardia brasiliensis]|uniref:hypothetical protein n=1 Tax=Nocardia brasiliensis TaxID=37326 RepID=UPI0024589039|nr:hypothetical protein [Nocardia brasiliensis]